MKITLTPTSEIPDGVPTFDTENGCYYHACGCLTSWFRRNGDGWSILEWAAWLNPEYSAALCDELASFTGEGMFTVTIA